LESLKDYSVGIGANIDFSPEDHQALEKIYFTRIQDGRFILFTDWSEIR